MSEEFVRNQFNDQRIGDVGKVMIEPLRTYLQHEIRSLVCLSKAHYIGEDCTLNKTLTHRAVDDP